MKKLPPSAGILPRSRYPETPPMTARERQVRFALILSAALLIALSIPITRHFASGSDGEFMILFTMNIIGMFLAFAVDILWPKTPDWWEFLGLCAVGNLFFFL